jgi:hypothetical protein
MFSPLIIKKNFVLRNVCKIQAKVVIWKCDTATRTYVPYSIFLLVLLVTVTSYKQNRRKESSSDFKIFLTILN